MRDHVLSDPVREVLVLWIGAQVREGQHGDRPPAGTGRIGRCERLEEREGRGEPIRWNSGECLDERLLDRDRHGVPNAAHPGHRVPEPLGNDGLGRGPGVGWLAGEQLVQDAREGIDVRAGAERGFAHRLLRAHVGGRAGDEAGLGEPVAAGNADCTGDPEVAHHCVSRLEQDVLGLDISVDDVAAVSVAQRVRDLSRDAECILQRELLFAIESAAEGLAFDKRHDVVEYPVGFPGVVEWEDVRMTETGGGLDLAQEPFWAERSGDLWLEDFDGDLPMMLEVLGQVDRGHSAATELALDGIAIGDIGTQARQ